MRRFLSAFEDPAPTRENSMPYLSRSAAYHVTNCCALPILDYAKLCAAVGIVAEDDASAA